MLAVGGTYQELTASTPLMSANTVFRIWRKGQSYVLKVYGTDARERREHHALNALGRLSHLPKIRDRGVHDQTAWIMFEDAGRWNLQSLPENPGLAREAGQILRDIHDVDARPLSNLSKGMDGEWIAVDFQSSVKRLERYRSRVGVAQTQIDAAMEIKPPYASAPVVTHTDPVMRNFIVDEEGDLTLIDWEWATLSPPEWDLSKLVWSAGMHAGPSAADAVIDGYGSDIEGVQMDRWIVYHSAQTLLQYAERNLSARPGDVPDNLVAEFNRAVLGASA
ncbi:MAG: aminoglycoside phosphotransferase family protein [Acidimicrobiia bacterium]